MTSPDGDPFAILGLLPTLDRTAIKRAYFAQLAEHPPQQDPIGFRRLREAYELLISPAGLARSFLAAPIDLATEANRYRQRFDPAIEQAVTIVLARADRSARVAQLVDAMSWHSLGEVLAACRDS
jgi:hypothetical protein